MKQALGKPYRIVRRDGAMLVDLTERPFRWGRRAPLRWDSYEAALEVLCSRFVGPKTAASMGIHIVKRSR